ncbi:P-loop NTPase [candidate division KSB1 bacterium]|nr:P-loop NTPase [candidate division KSB1 bacterium]
MHFQNNTSTPHIIAIGGGKGGVGKSTCSATLALFLAKEGKKTVLIDADFAGPNLHYLFSIYDRTKPLTRFFADSRENLEDLRLETGEKNLNLIINSYGRIDYRQLVTSKRRRFLSQLRQLEADFVVLDLGPGANFTNLDIFLAADSQIVVSTCENIALFEAYQFLRASVFRMLEYHSEDRLELRNALQTFGDLRDKEDVKTLKNFLDQNASISRLGVEQFMRRLAAMRPILLVNAIQESDETRTIQALRLALQRVLDLDLELVGKIRFDQTVKEAVAHGNMDYSGKNPVFQDIKTAVTQSRRIKAMYHPFVGDHQLKWDQIRICNHHCVAWNCCGKRNGGTPCAVLHPDLVQDDFELLSMPS